MRFIVATVLLLAALAAAAPQDDMSRHKPTKPPKPTTTTTTRTTTTEEVTELPPFRGDYELLGNFGYYKIFITHSSWWNAWETCFLEGSHLLLLRSQEERDALVAWKPWYEIPGYSWYGAHHRFRDHQFVTLFDTPLSESGYNKWMRDFGNKTLYNNVDWPDMVVTLRPSEGEEDGLLLVRARSSHFFICKMDI